MTRRSKGWTAARSIDQGSAFEFLAENLIGKFRNRLTAGLLHELANTASLQFALSAEKSLRLMNIDEIGHEINRSDVGIATLELKISRKKAETKGITKNPLFDGPNL